VNDDVVSSVIQEAVLRSYAGQQICLVQWNDLINAGILQSDSGFLHRILLLQVPLAHSDIAHMKYDWTGNKLKDNQIAISC
jgi:hypothetical protein